MTPRPRAEQGFTLVETLVAFTILVATITVAFQVIGASMNNLARVKEQTHRLAVARQVLAQLELTNAAPRTEVSGVVEGTGWTVTSVSLPANQGAPVASRLIPYHVQVFVRDSQTHADETPVLDTVLLLPRAVP